MKKIKEYLIMNFNLALVIFVAAACQDHQFYEEKVFAGNKRVSASMLNLGHTTYIEYCVQCHGVKGDGMGPSSKGLYPPPRDFTKGLFKFVDGPSGELPSDDQLKHIIIKGLKGTAMLPWDMQGDRLEAVVQYVKTFAPKVWENKDKALGEKIVLKPDPFTAQTIFATERGKEVYHIVSNCQSCHRAYATKAEINDFSVKAGEKPIVDFDENMYKIKNQDSEYGVKTLPPDFTWHEVRSATTVEELAHRIASGIGGTAMPSWKGVLEDEDIWAVAYYVKSLMNLKGTEDRKSLIKKLENQ